MPELTPLMYAKQQLGYSVKEYATLDAKDKEVLKQMAADEMKAIQVVKE